MSGWGRHNNKRNRCSLWGRKSNDHVYFTRPSLLKTNDSSKNNHIKTIYIFNSKYEFNGIEYVEKIFTITTKNGSYKFNIDLLKETSNLIKSSLESHPDTLNYHLKSKDSLNIMSKIEKLYSGETISILEEENNDFNQIINELNISNSFRLDENDKENFKNSNWRSKAILGLGNSIKFDFKGELQIIKKNFNTFIIEKMPKDFIISTKSKEYICNKVCVNSSKVIRDFISKNPGLNRFEFDFSDDCNEFQPISDFFNTNVVLITADNMRILKTIAEDLEIDIILDDIDDFINEYEKRVQTIDDQQSILDSINELFETLYKIKEITVNIAKDKIVDSNWSKTEESVQELSAFILQAIRTDVLLHPYLADLIELLDKESDETNRLDVLIPFITNKLMFLFGDNKLISSFIFKLWQKKIIKKEEIFEKLKEAISNSNSLNDSVLIFLPEIYEIMNKSFIQFLYHFSGNCHKFISSWFPEKIEEFKKMRESGEPDDQVTKSLRCDDVDTLQSIISTNHIDLSKAVVPYNIFEEFVANGETNYINYSAAYGSLKCFKYLLLNHAQLNDSSFLYAVFGGNIEIVKIVDQQKLTANSSFPNNKLPSQQKMRNQISYRDQAIKSFYNSEKIIPTIIKHKNDLFDWILEQKYSNASKNNEFISNILLIAVENGDCHPIASVIDMGFDFVNFDGKICQLIVQKAAKNGFFKLLEFLSIIMKKKIEQFDKFFDEQSAVYYGNLSIFKFYHERLKKIKFNEILSFAITHDYKKIVEFIFDNDKDKITFNSDYIQIILDNSIDLSNDDLFDYLIEQLKKIDEKIFSNFTDSFIDLLSKAANLGKVETSKKITKLIFEQNKNDNDNDDSKKIDFSLPFFNAAVSGSSEICQFFIDSKVYINFELILLQVQKIASVNKDVMDILIQNISPNSKEILISCYIKEAIHAKNKYLIEYLLKENSFCNDALFEAVNTGDLEIVNMILNKNSTPSFINQISTNGTALNLAVSRNCIDIVKRFLTIPGIDLSLYESDNMTPLITSISENNVEIFDAIIEYYGPNIQSQAWQINEAIKFLLMNIPIISNFKNKDSNMSPILNKIIDFEFVNLNSLVNGFTIFLFCCQNNEIEIVKKMIKIDKVDVNLCAEEEGNTPLMVAIESKNIEIAKLLIECDRTNINKKNCEEETALSIAVQQELIEIVDALINNEKFNSFESRLDFAFYLSSEEIAKKLISSKNVDINLYSTDSGYTLLMIAIEKKYIEVAKLLIESDKTKINHRNYNNETALTKSVRMDLIEIVDCLIKNEKFDPSESCLDFAFYLSSEEMAKKLISVKNLDVNYHHIKKTSSYELSLKSSKKNAFSKLNARDLLKTPLIVAVEDSQFEMVDLIINHPSFNIQKSFVKEAVFSACKNNTTPISVFKKLIDLIGGDLNIVDGNGNCLLEVALSYNCTIDFIREILNNEKFDYKKCNFQKILISYFHKSQCSSDAMKELFDFVRKHKDSVDLNSNLYNGNSFYTLINKDFDIKQTVKFLIENGADPNIPNNNGVYPLEYAINNLLYDYVEALIDSGKIDFSIRLNKSKSQRNKQNSNLIDADGKTYLHLAARCSKEEILSLFLTRKLIDINVTDSNGETPLMEACRAKNIENIHLLFSMDDLDYAKCNNKGNDALCILRGIKDIKSPETKEKFLQNIISIIGKEKNKSNFSYSSTVEDLIRSINKVKEKVNNEEENKENEQEKSENTSNKEKGEIKQEQNDIENQEKEKDDEDKEKQNDIENKDKEEEKKDENEIKDENNEKEKDDEIKEKENKEHENIAFEPKNSENSNKEGEKENENKDKKSENESHNSSNEKVPHKMKKNDYTFNNAYSFSNKIKNQKNGLSKFCMVDKKNTSKQESNKNIEKKQLKSSNFWTNEIKKEQKSKIEDREQSEQKQNFNQSNSSNLISSSQKSNQLSHSNFWISDRKISQKTNQCLSDEKNSHSELIEHNELDSHFSSPNLNHSSDKDLSMREEVIAAIGSSISSIDPDQISQISLNLSVIAEKRAKKIAESIIAESKPKEENVDIKQQHQIKFNERLNEEVKDDGRKNKRFESSRKFLDQKIENEFDWIDDFNDDQNQFNFVEQQQWYLAIQMNNIRNAQFNMIMQQQEQMMWLMENETKKDKGYSSSRQQSKKKKKKNRK